MAVVAQLCIRIQNRSAEARSAMKRDMRGSASSYFRDRNSGRSNSNALDGRRTAAEKPMEDVLFFAGIELVAVLVCAPFALRRPTPPDAWVAGTFGVLGVASIIGFLLGLHADHWDFKRGIAWLGMLLVTV